MVFALLGGDDRFVRLAASLEGDGHAVIKYAMEQALPDCAETAEAALRTAEAAVLPLPCEKNGVLNAPLSAVRRGAAELLHSAPAGLPVFAGAPGEGLRAFCETRGLPLLDYSRREEFTLRNADLTAEGVLPLLLEGSPRALRGSKILITGFGRIGRALAEKLLALGAGVAVAARSPAARTAAELLGCAALPLEGTAGAWDAVVNTIPVPLLGQEALEGFRGARLIELASPPYGFDFAAAEALGNPVVLAAGLPGRTAPQTAAEVLKLTVYAILEERGSNGTSADRAGPDRLVLHL